MTCTVDFNIDDTRASLAAFLGRARDIFRAGDGDQWTLDCRRARYLGPYAVALIASCVLQARLQRQRFVVYLPDQPQPLAGFLRFSGLRHLLDGESLPDPDVPENETVPLATFSGVEWNLADPVVRLIARHVELSEEDEDRLRMSMREVIHNIKDHAVSQIGGVLSAKFFRGRNEVRIAIADRGLGIPSAIRRRHPEIRDDCEVLRRVVVGGLSSKSTPRNRGLGVSNLAAAVRACGGRLILVAGGALAEVMAGTEVPTVTPLTSPFPGTAAFFTLRVGRRC